MKKLILKLLFAPCFVFSILQAQVIEEDAARSYLRHGNAEPYFSPLVDVLSSTLHTSSLYYKHPDSNRSFHIYIGATVVGAFIPSNMKSFDGHTEAPYSPTTTIHAPTIFGDNNSNTYYDQYGNAYNFPGGFDIRQINMAVPNIHVGTLLHTNFSGKFFALNVGGDLKKIELFGFGFNHFISDYWNAKNYFVSAGASFDQIKLGGYMKGKQFLAQITGGQQLGIFNYWVHAQYQKSPYEFFYEDELEGNGTVKINGQSNIRAGLGLGLQLWKFYLHGEGSGFKPFIGALGIGLQF